jgi:CBS domain-containing protein
MRDTFIHQKEAPSAQPFGGAAEQDGVTALQASVADVMITSAPAVPPWITVRAARRVAELKASAHLLLEENGRLLGLLRTGDLAAASDDDPVAAWASQAALFVGPNTPVERARQMMLKNATSCLPVVAGAFLVGLVTRDGVERALARPAGAHRREGKRRRRTRRAAA